jgi:hypothetical protein
LPGVYPVIIRKMCRTISSEQKKSVDPFPVLTKKGIFCRSISVGAVDPFHVGVVDPFPEVVSIHFSRPPHAITYTHTPLHKTLLSTYMRRS